MKNLQMFYIKITILALLISLLVTLGLGSILFASSQKFVEVEERTSRIELERALEKIISHHQECNQSLKGILIPEVGGFTEMEVLTYEDGEVAIKSNTKTRSLYVEQIRLGRLDQDSLDSKILIEVYVPIRSQRDQLVKLKTIKLKALIQKDSSGRVAGCLG